MQYICTTKWGYNRLFILYDVENRAQAAIKDRLVHKSLFIMAKHYKDSSGL